MNSTPKPAQKPSILMWILGIIFLLKGLEWLYQFNQNGTITFGSRYRYGPMVYSGILAIAAFSAVLILGMWIIWSCISQLRKYQEENNANIGIEIIRLLVGVSACFFLFIGIIAVHRGFVYLKLGFIPLTGHPVTTEVLCRVFGLAIAYLFGSGLCFWWLVFKRTK